MPGRPWPRSRRPLMIWCARAAPRRPWRRTRRTLPIESGDWRVIAPPGHPLTAALEDGLRRAGKGHGVVLCLPPKPDERHIGLLLEGARAALNQPSPSRFVLVQDGAGAAAWARTLHLESPATTTCVVDVPFDHPQAAEWVVAEALAAAGYVEARYDASGRRCEPRSEERRVG